MAELSREDFIKQYGFDPEPVAVDAAGPKGLPSLGNAARDVGVGFATALTDAVAIPGVVYAASGALKDKLTGEGDFGAGFKKRIVVSDAEVRTKDLIAQRQKEWQQQFPDIDADGLNDLTKQYVGTKEFERFNTDLIDSPGVKMAQKAKHAVRDFVGDTRTEKERGWTDDALEAVGSAGFGIGPATAARVGKSFATSGIGKAALDFAPSRIALKTAEVLTPITLPLTPTNFALNAGAGVAISQAMRYAQGDTTALTGDDSDIGGIAATGAAIGAGGMVIAALRGRAARVSQLQVPTNTPEMAAASAAGSEHGALLNAGKELNQFENGPPKPTQNGLSVTGGPNKLLNAIGDETAIVRNLIEKVHGKAAAKQFEAEFSNYTGAGGRDAADHASAKALEPLERELAKFNPEELKNIEDGWLASIAESRNKQVETRYNTELDELLAERAKHEQSSVAFKSIDKSILDKKTVLTDFVNDVPATRRMLPDIPRHEIQKWDNFFRSDPKLEGVRNAVLKMNDDMLSEAVRRGSLSQTDAATMRSTTPFYAPLQQDPLEGSQGIARLGRAFLSSFDAKKQQEIRTANKPLMSTIDTAIKTDGDIARITRPLSPLETWKNYARNMHQEIQNNELRRTVIDALEKNPDGTPSPYMKQNNIDRFELGDRREFTAAELRGNPALRDVVDDPNYARVIRNGMTSFYRFGDPEVASLMRLEPTMFNGWAHLAKMPADVWKANTTGVAAPIFAPINALYDTTFASFIRPVDRAFGPIDTALRKVLGQELGGMFGGRIPDPTAFATLPWHVIAGLGEQMAIKSAKLLAKDMARNGIMSDIAKAIGVPQYEKLVERMLLATERSKTAILMEKGIMHNSAMNDLARATDTYSYAASSIPAPIRGAYTFYKDLLNSVHGAPKREFWAQNYSLLERKYGDNIPKSEIDRLVYDTRAMAGDMTRRSGSAMQRQFEAATPYTAPMRNGVYALARALDPSDLRQASYVYPRLVMGMTGIMASFYMMSNWDEAARTEFWKNTPDWMRYRYIHLPTPELLMKWHNGEKPAFDPKLIYKVPLGPDLAPIIAGTAAFLRGIGALPNDPSVVPNGGVTDLIKMTKDMVSPMVPTFANVALAPFGVNADISGSDSRAGNWLRIANTNPFRKGPGSEASSNLGEMNTVTQMMLASLFGANGTYISRSADAFMHAAKYNINKNDPKTGLSQTRIGGYDYFEGLKAATTSYVDQVVRRAPDVPGLWKGNEKQYTQTPIQELLKHETEAMSSIKGIRDDAFGPRAQQKGLSAIREGGVRARYLTDPALRIVADDVRKWAYGQGGEFYQMNQLNGTLASNRRAIEADYTMPRDQKMDRVNKIIDQQQELQEQQRLAVMWKVDQLKQTYGSRVPALTGLKSMRELDQILRASIQ